MPVVETAVSLNFKHRSDAPGVLRDARNGKEHPLDSLDTKILVYEDRVAGWFLRVADNLKKNDGDAGYVALQIAISQVEGLQQYREGKSSDGASKAMFVAGMRYVFGLDAEKEGDLERFYKAARCGLFHDGFTKGGVFLSGKFADALGFVGDQIQVNPWRFVEAVEQAFRAFITELKDTANNEAREDFEKHWDEAQKALV